MVKCNQTSECHHGECSNEICVCASGYVTYGSTACDYKQSNKLTAYLLSFFVGNFGADWFYLSRGNAGYIFIY